MKIRILTEGEPHEIDLDDTVEHTWTPAGNGVYRLRLGQELHTIDSIQIEGDRVRFMFDGRPVDVAYQDEQAQLLARLGFKKSAANTAGSVKAPMPGRILSLQVEVGHEVSAGQPVAVLEAMKMENEIRSPLDGRIKAVHVREGQTVEKNTLLLEIDPVG